MPDILPDCRLQNTKDSRRIVTQLGVLNWVQIFCANCGADGGRVPEENMTFAFYLCTPCAEKWSPLAGTMIEPDAVFWQKVKDAQIEKYGRELTAPEVAEQLKDGDSILSKLARERKDLISL